METSKQRSLRPAAAKARVIPDFQLLTDQEMEMVNLKVRLVALLKSVREARAITQQELARRMRSSQASVAKLEAKKPRATLDLICRALFSAGVSPQEIGRVIATKKATTTDMRITNESDS